MPAQPQRPYYRIVMVLDNGRVITRKSASYANIMTMHRDLHTSPRWNAHRVWYSQVHGPNGAVLGRTMYPIAERNASA